MAPFFFSRFKFRIRCKTPLLLPPYKGSTLRGGFGHAFRRIACALKDEECADCLLREQCVYAYVFETPIPPDAEMMRKCTVAPHPFVLEPPPERQKVYEAGEDLSFGLTLIGRATEFLPYFIYAFDELGRIGIGKGKGKYELREVFEENCPNHEDPSNQEADNGRSIYRWDSKLLAKPDGPVLWSDLLTDSRPSPDVMRLSFTTPARIKYDGRLTKDLQFHVLFRNLLRRISLLSYFHCGHKLNDQDFKDMIGKAREVKTVKKVLYWDDWQRYSNRQGVRMNMGGFLGEIAYEGNFEPFWPYVRLGEYVHVGKGSSFGLGRYGIS